MKFNNVNEPRLLYAHPNYQAYQASDYQSAVDYIANFDAKYPLPVLIKVLEEVTRNIASDTTLTQKDSLDFIKSAIKLLNENNDKLKLLNNPFNIRKVISSLDAKNILKDLTNLVETAANINVTNNTFLLWHEVCFWLTGIYKHTADRVKNLTPNPDGTLGTIDWEDAIFYKLTHTLTKYSVAQYYLQAAIAIAWQLEAFSTLNAKTFSHNIIDIIKQDEKLLPLVQAQEAIVRSRLEESVTAQFNYATFFSVNNNNNNAQSLKPELVDITNNHLINRP